MTVSLEIGWWLAPTAMTVVSAAWALWPRAGDRRSGDWDSTFWIPAAFRLAGSVIATLLAWLVWSLAR